MIDPHARTGNGKQVLRGRCSLQEKCLYVVFEQKKPLAILRKAWAFAADSENPGSQYLGAISPNFSISGAKGSDSPKQSPKFDITDVP